MPVNMNKILENIIGMSSFLGTHQGFARCRIHQKLFEREYLFVFLAGIVNIKTQVI